MSLRPPAYFSKSCLMDFTSKELQAQSRLADFWEIGQHLINFKAKLIVFIVFHTCLKSAMTICSSFHWLLVTMVLNLDWWVKIHCQCLSIFLREGVGSPGLSQWTTCVSKAQFFMTMQKNWLVLLENLYVCKTFCLSKFKNSYLK